MTIFIRPDGLMPRAVRAATANKEVFRLRSYAILAFADVAMLAVAFLGANLLHLRDLYSVHGLTMLTVVAPIYLVLAAYNKAYSGRTLEHARTGMVYAVQAFCGAAAAVLFLAYFLKAGDEFSRIVFTLGSVGSIILLCAARAVVGRSLLRSLGGSPFTTVVIRDDVPYEAQVGEIVITPEQLGFDPHTQDPHLYHSFAHAVASADRLIVACPQSAYKVWSMVLKGMSIDGEILTDERDSLGILGIGCHGRRQTLVVSVEPLHLRQRLLKRLFDIGFGLAALILLSPFLLATAIAIRLDTPGPVFFVQDRIGRDNRIFRMFKFRSMYVDRCDDHAGQLTMRGDDRVTRVGRFIRSRSIDELPQLLNVLNGTMSVVGPRPHAISAKAGDLLYWDVDVRYRHRHSIKPGLTGLAQVRGFRGATEKTEDLTSRLTADLEYLANWSISRDFWIILQTLGVLRHRNAF